MRLTRAHVLKLVGIAGAVGVAATGVLVARNERQRRAYTPDEVRERLHVRYAQATAPEPPNDTAAQPDVQLSSQHAGESDENDALRRWGRLRERARRLTRRNR
jgi:hypothetical protein